MLVLLSCTDIAYIQQLKNGATLFLYIVSKSGRYEVLVHKCKY